MTTVTVLGTGIMGSAMARRLLEAGFHVRVWNRTRARTQPLTDAGAVAAATPAEAVQGADLAITMLADGRAIEAVLEDPDGLLGGMQQGTVWAQMSTVGIEDTRRFGERAEGHGLTFVDAPVVGTKQPAEQGELVVLAAGPDSASERCGPAFDAVGKRTLWLGSAGAGTRLKLVVNNWIAGLVCALAESISHAEGLGVDPRQFLEAIGGGPLDAGYAHIKGQAMLDRAFEPSFPLRLAHKDMQLVLEACSSHALKASLSERLAELFEQASTDHGDEDVAAVYFATR